MLFVAVALFAALAFVFMQGSRSSTSMIMDEATNAKAVQTLAYSQATNLAVKRLKLRGCKDSEISYEAPNGSNANPSAPADKHCHLFHVNGGGIQYAGAPASAVDPCLSGAVGTVCTADGAVYVGTSGGNRIYAAGTNAGTNITWGGNGYSVATSTSNGKTNTDLLITGPAGNTYPAAIACRAMGPAWFLPSKDELLLLWTNSVLGGGTIDVTTIGISTSGNWYWASSQNNSTGAWRQRFSTGTSSADNKTASYRYHCFRH